MPETVPSLSETLPPCPDAECDADHAWANEIVEHLNFCIGNAIKYLWRAGLKGDDIEDLEKARWYVDREINRRREQADHAPPG